MLRPNFEGCLFSKSQYIDDDADNDNDSAHEEDLNYKPVSSGHKPF